MVAVGVGVDVGSAGVAVGGGVVVGVGGTVVAVGVRTVVDVAVATPLGSEATAMRGMRTDALSAIARAAMRRRREVGNFIEMFKRLEESLVACGLPVP